MLVADCILIEIGSRFDMREIYSWQIYWEPHQKTYWILITRDHFYRCCSQTFIQADTWYFVNYIVWLIWQKKTASFIGIARIL